MGQYCAKEEDVKSVGEKAAVSWSWGTTAMRSNGQSSHHEVTQRWCHSGHRYVGGEGAVVAAERVLPITGATLPVRRVGTGVGVCAKAHAASTTRSTQVTARIADRSEDN